MEDSDRARLRLELRLLRAIRVEPLLTMEAEDDRTHQLTLEMARTSRRAQVETSLRQRRG